jgi:acyl carrier protein
MNPQVRVAGAAGTLRLATSIHLAQSGFAMMRRFGIGPSQVAEASETRGRVMMSIEEEVRGVLGNVLQLGERTRTLTRSSGLLGTLPELDSMAVVGVIGELESQFGIQFADDEITADSFQTLGTLTDLIEQKLAS